MSRENKVNPGKYTQRGRLSPDDAAREMAKQRASTTEQPSGAEQKNLPRKPQRRQKESGEENIE